MSSTAEDRTVSFEASLDRPLEEVARLMLRDAAHVLGNTSSHDENRLVVELDVPLGQHGSVRRAAVMRTGQPDWRNGQYTLPITLSALDSERWFPTFAGVLGADDADLGSTRLRLTGRYELPLGAIGRATGPLGGDRSARASLYALFLAVVAGAERGLREGAPSWRPAAMPESLREEDRPIDA